MGIRPEHFSSDTGCEEVINVGVEIVQQTESGVFGTFFIGRTHVVAEFGAHEVTVAGTSIALSVAMDCTSFFVPTAVRRSARRQSAR